MTEAAKEYAGALFELACEEKKENEVFSQLKAVESEFKAHPDYIDILSSPDISVDKRCRMIEEAFEKSVFEYVVSFLALIIKNGRIKDYSDFVYEYELMLMQKNRISKAVVTSAFELSDSEKQKLTDKLEKLGGKKVEAVYKIDKSLIGGLTVFIDGKIIDGSLKNSIKEVKEELDK